MSSPEHDERSDGTESDDERNQNRNLFQAICDRDFRKFLQQLIHVKDINKIIDYNNKNNTLLHYAVYKNEIEIVRELMCSKWKTDLNARNIYGNTPLHVAALRGHKEHVESLLNAGADSSIRNGKFQTALELAKDPEIIDMLTVQSQAGTSGLGSSRNLEQQQKRKESCNAYSQPKRPKNSLERKRSNDEDSEFDNHESKKLKTSKDQDYRSSGLKLSQHGVAYQLKLLMLCMKRGVDRGYSFRLATEMDAAEKFDDLVFRYEEGKKMVHRFLQAKHKQNESENISTNDLLTQTDGNFSLQKYFISYRKIKRNPEFNGINDEIKDLIICTNIGFKLGDKRGELTLSDDIFDIIRDETIFQTDLLQFKKDFVGRKDIVSILKNATDLMKLATKLFDVVLDDNSTKKVDAKKDARDDLLTSYEFALAKEVIDEDSKKLRHEFVTNAECLSSEARNFRKAFECVFHDRRKTYNLDLSRVIESEDLENFAQEVAELIQQSDGSGEIIVQKYKKVIKNNFDKLAGYVLVKEGSDIKFSSVFLKDKGLPGNLSDFRKSLFSKLPKTTTVDNNMARYKFKVYDSFKTCDKMYVDANAFWEVIKEINQKKEFNLSDNFGKWNANLETVDVFVKRLVHLIEESRKNDQLTIEVKGQDITFSKNINKLAKYAFIEENDGIRFSPQFLENDPLIDNLNKFRDQLKARVEDIGELRFAINNFPKSRLPNDSITDIDSDIESFLNKLVFAVNQPNEIILGNIIDTEMAECRDINLIDSEFLASYYQKYMYDWMKDKKGRFLTLTEGKRFFDEMAKKLTTLQLTGLTREYRFIMKQMNIRFTKDKIELRKFLEPENTMQLFILRSMPDAIFGLIQVYQILETMQNYEKDDSYIFIRYDSFSCMQDLVIDAFCSRSEHLLIIKCKSYKDSHERSLTKLCEAIKSNKTRKLILITEKDNELANTLRSMFSDRSVVEEIKVNGLFDLDEESRDKIIKQSNVNFQGQEVSLSKLMISEKSINHLNAEALSKLINNETLEIGKRLQDLDDVRNYYITRTFQRHENIDRSFQDDTSSFVDCGHVKSITPEKVTDISEKIAIISAEPGMGKSTVLTHLAVQTKISEPTTWIAKINLSADCSKKLREMNDNGLQFDNERTIDFLLSSAKLGTLEREFFKDFYEGGEMILLFDGFDEISPDYTNKVMELLTFLKGTRVKKIWVTTRPYNIKNNLEDELGSFSYVLKELSKDDQNRLFKEFWKTRLNLNKLNDERADFFIFMLFINFALPINDFERKFFTMPLHIRMIADVCQKVFRNFHDSSDISETDINAKLGESLELVNLYENFFNVKFKEIRFGEKKPGWNSADTDSRYIMKRKIVNDVEIHEILALEDLYPQHEMIPREIIINLMKNMELSEIKTGIIVHFIDDKPVFVHRSFAEYFAALWFSKKWRKENVKEFLKNHLFSETSEVIQNFLDRMLTRNESESSKSESHGECSGGANKYVLVKAVSQYNLCKVKEILDKDEKFLHRTDNAGRTLLHLAATCIYESFALSLLNEIRKRVEQNILTHALSVKDELFEWTPLTYAFKKSNWKVTELLLQMNASSEDILHAIRNLGLGVLNSDEQTLLHTAAANGHLEIAKLLLKEGAIIDACDKDARTPLHLASRGNQFEMVKYLCEKHDANFEATDRHGRTPLHIAVEIGNLEMIKYLVDQKNVNPMVVDNTGCTPLHLASLTDNLEVAEYFIAEKDVNLEAVDKHGRTPLHFAATRSNLQMIKYLVEKKNANLNTVDRDGYTPLHIAIKWDRLENVKYFFDQENYDFSADGKDRDILHLTAFHFNTEVARYLLDEKNANFEAVDRNGCTFLHIAVSRGDLEIVRHLVDEKKANFEAVDGNGCTPLHTAVSRGDLEIVRYLVDEKKANLEAVDRLGQTPLQFATCIGKLEIVKYFVDEKNLDFSAVDEEGKTLLHIASGERNLEMVKYLVGEKNANLKAIDEIGRTPLHYVGENRNLEVAKYLADQENVNLEAVDNEGCTPLHHAASWNNLKIVKFLIDKKNANLEAVNNEGCTPLHVATQDGNLEMVKYLVGEKNANLKAIDEIGRTPLHYVARNRNLEIAEYLADQENVNLDAVDNRGCTPLHQAASCNNLKVVEYFVEKKNANLQAIDKMGNTVLHFAASAGKLETVQYLIDKKNANLEAVNNEGCTPLHLATQEENLGMIEYLVGEKNANFMAVDKKGRTPLHYVTRNPNLETVKYLADQKNVNLEAVDDRGRTPYLHYAAACNNLETVEYFVEKKNANLQAIDKMEYTVLHFAASAGEVETVQYLIDKKNANLEAVNNEGRTPLHVATLIGNLELVKYFVDEKNANLEAVDKYGYTPLHIASHKGNLEMVEYLVDEKNANFEAVDKKGRTPLDIASEINKFIDVIIHLSIKELEG